MSFITVLGLNHKTAPVSTREKLAFTSQQVEEFTDMLLDEVINEAVVISTCNRTEIYMVTDEPAGGDRVLVYLLGRYCSLHREAFVPFLYRHESQEAARHLFEVVCGLDSLVVGETQILGQVKEAYQQSSESGGAGPILHGLFQQALTVGKRVHTETGINDNAASVSYAAVELARNIWGNLSGKSILLIGAGKMSELAAKHLFESGATSLVVMNRNQERALAMADKIRGGVAASYDQLHKRLQDADIVISSTGAPHIILTADTVLHALMRRGGRPMLLIDIAVPRDIEGSAAQLKNVYLYNIDMLESVVNSNMEKRLEEAEKARLIIGEEVESFMAWYKTRDVVPLIAGLRRKADDIRLAELAKFEKKLEKLGHKERNLVESFSKSLVNALLREPILHIKGAAQEEEAEAETYKMVVSRLFELPPGGSSGKTGRCSGFKVKADESKMLAHKQE